MEEIEKSNGPLNGIKVLDLTHAIAGPSCTLLLADMGADVIKVEPPMGDQLRHILEGFMFINYNRNKRGIVLDLKKKEGKEITQKLAQKTDVLVENFVPGTTEKWGLGYDVIRKLNPGIIYCSISGFGQEGPYRDRPAYDPIVQAMSGIMEVTGEPDRPPARILPAVIDYTSGINGAFAIVVSLFERQKTGEGQRIDVALLDVAVNLMGPYAAKYKKTGKLPQRAGSAQPAWVPYQNFETRDGLVMISASTDRMWKSFCEALRLDELGHNPSYTTLEGRQKHREELVKDLNQITRQYSSEEIESILLAADVPCARVQNVGEVIRDPHVQARKILEEVDYSTMGNVLTVKTPIFFSGSAASTRRNIPLLGQHTREVLLEIGYSDLEINDFIKQGVAVQYKP